MNTYSLIMTYCIIWWVVLFTVLPIGVKTDPNPQPGHARGAPLKAHIPQKLIATTLTSIPIFLLVKWIIDNNLFGI